MKKCVHHSDYYDTKKSKGKVKAKAKYQDVKGKPLSDNEVKEFLAQFDEPKQHYYKNILMQAFKEKRAEEASHPHNNPIFRYNI